ncbi:MAG: hypothetical protein GY806_10005, partial [Gammaproteobacteria bacterium]|nr:hypothetical protein [Gammaproteobacteria bacterium]
STRTANLSNIDIIDYNGDGWSTGYSAIRVLSSSSATTVLNLNNLTMTEPGNTGNYGLYLYANGGHMNGSVDLVDITNPGNDGLHILNSSSGDVNIALSNITVDGSPNNSIEVSDSYTTSGLLNTSFDGTNSITNNSTTATAIRIENNNPDFLLTGSVSVTTAGYGMNLVNSAGNFNNFTLDNTVIAGIRLASGSNPAEFSNVVLTNAVTPYELVGQDLTATITGGYDFSDISVAKSYIRVGGTLLNNMTLTPNPIGAGSVWRVYSSITVPSAYVLTVEDGAVLKFDLNQILTIDGSLAVGDGDGLGTKAVFTSILDDTVGGDTNGDAGATTPAWNNWGYIRVNDNSTID